MTLHEVYVTKMCHDLAGVIGTLGNTVELAEMDADFMADGIALLKESSTVLRARLQFFRALLGLEQPIEQEMAERYLKTHTPSFEIKNFMPTRLSLAWVLLATECLLRGGNISIFSNECRLEGASVLLDETKERILTGAETVLNPQYMAALWIREEIERQGKKLVIQKRDSGLTFSLS